MSDAKSETVKKANKRRAAMKDIGQKIAEFGVKNMEARSKARGSKNTGTSKPKTNAGVMEPTGKGAPLKTGSGNSSQAYAKKKSF